MPFETRGENREQALLFGPLTGFGERDFNFDLFQRDSKVVLPDDVLRLRNKLRSTRDLPFYDGPFINVDRIFIQGHDIKIEASVTSNFDFVAATYNFRNHQEDNPVRPLAVQTSIFSPGVEKLILRRRPSDVTDAAGTIDTFGGALQPGELDMFKAIQSRLKRKWNIDTATESIISTGMGYSDITNVVCLYFMIELTENQYQVSYDEARRKMRDREAVYYEISLKENPFEQIKKMFLGKRDITKWEPFSFYNILYALSARGILTAEQVKELLDDTRKLESAISFKYNYPMENYL